MPLFRDLVVADPRGERRYMKLSKPGFVIGVKDAPSAKGAIPMIWVFRDGEPDRVLSKREIQGLLIDVEPDWRIANR